MKYRLLKDLPECKAGEILVQSKKDKDVFNFTSVSGFYTKEYIEKAPDWFSPYLFTTEDGIDIYKINRRIRELYGVNLQTKELFTVYEEGFENLDLFVNKVFFSCLKRNKYFKSLNNFEFEKDIWYVNNHNEHMCFQEVKDGKVYGYGFTTEKYFEDASASWDNYPIITYKWKKADTEKVKSLLLSEAERRYPIGTKYKMGDEIWVSEANFDFWNIRLEWLLPYDKNYFDMTSSMDGSGHIVYVSGKWAEVIKEKKYGVCPKGTWEIRTKEGSYLDADKNSSWKWFDTEEERIEYIRMNKPEFSREQVSNMLSEVLRDRVCDFTKHLIVRDMLKF